jgi:uncharacterized protein (TIGR02600 family)
MEPGADKLAIETIELLNFMNTNLSPIRKRTRRAVALVIVLTFLVLLSALLVAFFSSVQVESESAQNYHSTVTANQLASMAANIVTSQLSDATRSRMNPNDESSPRLAWASQPGMIRTWDDRGQGWKAFKLYSSRDMVVDMTSDGRYSVSAALPVEIPNDWPQLRSQFVDLNEPVLVADSANGKIDRDGRKFRAAYPIVDPLAGVRVQMSNGSTANPIDGFRLDPPPGYGGPATISASYDPSTGVAEGKTANPAPMPVRWIYVLRDGTLTVPTGSRDDGATATWEDVDEELAPRKENPIVGRIAFWADDESCKINVNTASEPTSWDTPRAVTIHDLRYGRFQPVQREFQRFPGHPYMTAISPVLLPGIANIPANFKENIFRFMPRVQPGGTVGGTVAPAHGAAGINLDEDRLFATVDDFLFQTQYIAGGMPERRPNPLTDPAGIANPNIQPSQLDPTRARVLPFFLTANSRAPEVNLFGQPRISLWPVGEASDMRSAFDRLSAFCATLGSESGRRAYYFGRSNAVSPTQDYTGIARNREVYNYLRELTSRPVPGYGASFVSSVKWGPANRDQILTQIFDYIRCTNLNDPQTTVRRKFAPNGQVTPIRIDTEPIGASSRTQTQGFGRALSISQFGLHFICSQEGSRGVRSTQTPGFQLPQGHRHVQAAFIFEPWSPSLGWFWMKESVSYEVTLSGFSVNGRPLFPAGQQTASMNDMVGNGWHCNGRERGGAAGIRCIARAFGQSNYRLSTPLGSEPLVTGDTMEVSQGTVQVVVRISGQEYQRFNLIFPGGTFPTPRLVTTGTPGYRGADPTNTQIWWSFREWSVGQQRYVGRYEGIGDAPHVPAGEYTDPMRRWNDGGASGFRRGGMFRLEDTVRSIVPEHGDMRLIAAKRNITSAEFVRVRTDLWNDPQARFLHIFSHSSGTHWHYGFANEPGPAPGPGIPASDADAQLTGSGQVRYHYSGLPEIRPGAGKLYNLWGDFDNGIAQWVDGAYINKPDEGNQSATNSPYTYFAWNFTAPTETFFSPSRLVPSAGMLGSLPTGVYGDSPRPWTTLLFRPEPRMVNNVRHPGLVNPPDHVLMDLFWTPVVEPYAISEPFSTGGKVNLNYEMAPFSYIRRTTALHGVMKGEEPLILPNQVGRYYKLWDHETSDNPYGLPNNAATVDPDVRREWGLLFEGRAPYDRLRRPIDVETTLSQADERFAEGDIFRSATQICELHLVRQGESLFGYRTGTIWNSSLITGDNTRERPYTNLYARLTTKSNVFNVHVRVQVLRQAPGNDPENWEVWREEKDRVLSEHRGSTIVERFIDPADPNLVDFADRANSSRTLDKAYKFRTVSTRLFTP